VTESPTARTRTILVLGVPGRQSSAPTSAGRCTRGLDSAAANRRRDATDGRGHELVTDSSQRSGTEEHDGGVPILRNRM
jgi:hypothetical protein